MDKTRIWHVLVIIIVTFLALWFAIPPLNVVVERRIVTEIEEDGVPISSKSDTIFTSKWAWLFRKTISQTRPISETKVDEKVEKKYIEEKVAPGRISLGLDLRGGSELRYEMVGGGDLSVSDREAARDQTVAIVQNRINVYGLKEPRVQREGSDRLLVQIPGLSRTEVERVKSIIETSGTLEFRIVDDAELDEARAGRVPRGYHLYTMQQGGQGEEAQKEHLVSDTPLLTGESIVEAKAGIGSKGVWDVSLRFDAQGGKRFETITSNHVGEPLGIVLNTRRERGEIVDPGTLYTAPEILEPIAGGRASISRGDIGFPPDEAKDLATTLQSGSLPLGLTLELENFVGPGLGEDSIRSSKKAIIISMLAVLGFMAVYYLVLGVITDFAMCLNLLIILGAMGLFHATLTLPGIAGLILTVGMAVDANILIFERIREERAKPGTSIATAVKNGYQRAFITIFDCNLTTLITALILLYVGTGPIKGFAITLSIGLITSVFTAVFVTRVITNVLIEKGILRELRMMRLLSNPNIPFVRNRRWAYIGSAALIVLGLTVFYGRGKKNLGVDFTGGVLAEMSLQKPLATSEVRSRLAGAGLAELEVQSIWTKEAELSSGGAKYADFEVRAGEGTDQKELLSKLQSIFQEELQPTPFPVLKRVPVKLDAEQQDPFAGGTVLVMNLKEPLHLSQIKQTLTTSLGYTDAEVSPADAAQPNADLVSSVQIKVKSTKPSEVRARLEEAFPVTIPFPRIEKIGAAVAQELQHKAYLAVTFSLIAMIIYLWFRFELRFGVAAVVALAHDVAISAGALAIADSLGLMSAKFNLPIVAALLTIVGYSVNDTIVVFDRVRENLASGKRMKFPDLFDLSINQTLSRTIFTSLTVFLVVFVLFVVAGGSSASLGAFSFVLMVGVVVGTYSSIFVAGALVVESNKWRELGSGKPARSNK